MAEKNEKLERGLAARKAALGEAAVGRWMDDPSSINQRWQNFVAEFAWGECWTDPTLSPRERSILMLGITAGLNRPEEFKGHSFNALKNGLNEAELEAALIQIGVYCGVPIGTMCQRQIAAMLKERAEKK